MATTTDQDVMEFARKGYDSVQDDRRAARESSQLADKNQDEYENELRKRLQGKIVIVTVSTETEEYFGQGGYEHKLSSNRLREEKMKVTGIFITGDKYRGKKKSPLVYASKVNDAGQVIRGSEVSFRLLDAKQLTIVP